MPPHEILVVDDDRDIRDMITLVLEGENFRVRTAENGSAALALLENFHPAVILLDMRMPVMDGWEFMRTFRKRHGDLATKTKVIVFTAAEDARLRAEEIGANQFISKPFDIDDIIRIVRGSV